MRGTVFLAVCLIHPAGVCAVICSVALFLLRICQCVSAVCAVYKPCKYLHLSALCRAVLGGKDLMHRVPQLLGDYRLMAVLDNYPFISWALDLFLAFHRLVFLLAVYQLSEIYLVIEYHSDRCYVPVEVLAPVVRLVVIGIMLVEIRYRREQLFLSEDLGHTVVAYALCGKPE